MSMASLEGEDLVPPCLVLPRAWHTFVVRADGGGRELLSRSSSRGGASSERRNHGEEGEGEDDGQDEDGEEMAEQEESEEEEEEVSEQQEEEFLSRAESCDDGGGGGGDDDDSRFERLWAQGSYIALNPLAVLLKRQGHSVTGNGAEERQQQQEEEEDDDFCGYACHFLFGNDDLSPAAVTQLMVDTRFTALLDYLVSRAATRSADADVATAKQEEEEQAAAAENQGRAVVLSMNEIQAAWLGSDHGGAQAARESMRELGVAPEGLRRLWRVLRYAGFCRPTCAPSAAVAGSIGVPTCSKPHKAAQC